MRFPNFFGEWEVKKLGEVAKFSKGKRISKSDIKEGGITECIRYGELYTHYGEVITEIKSRTNIDTADLVLSEMNDVIIPASGETQIDIATASCVSKSGIALGGDLNIIKTPNNGIFLSYYLNSKKKMDIASLAQGISVVHLYSSQLALLKINFPSLEEQTKIASFLALLDERISTQIKIIERLESLIQGVSKSLLNNKSTNIKLNDCLICHSSTLMEGNVYDSLGEYPVYGAVGVVAHTDCYDISEDAILIIKDGAGVGRVQYAQEKHSVTGTLNYLTPIAGIHLKYMYYCLRIFNFDKYKVGSGIPHIYFKDYGHEYIYCPPVEKQQRIASILSAIDEKIEIEKRILEEYTAQKKYLLKQMFI